MSEILLPALGSLPGRPGRITAEAHHIYEYTHLDQ